jgi:hypothetical protein
MSQAFPTHRQFIEQVSARMKVEYPDERGEGLNDCIKMQSTEEIWLTFLGKLIKDGVAAEQPVLDTLNRDQLYNLKKHYAPFESLQWYIPREFRNHKSYDRPANDPISKAAEAMDRTVIVSCVPPGPFEQLRTIVSKARKPKPSDEQKMIVMNHRQAPGTGLNLTAFDLHFGKVTGD